MRLGYDVLKNRIRSFTTKFRKQKYNVKTEEKCNIIIKDFNDIKNELEHVKGFEFLQAYNDIENVDGWDREELSTNIMKSLDEVESMLKKILPRLGINSEYQETVSSPAANVQTGGLDYEQLITIIRASGISAREKRIAENKIKELRNELKKIKSKLRN